MGANAGRLPRTARDAVGALSQVRGSGPTPSDLARRGVLAWGSRGRGVRAAHVIVALVIDTGLLSDTEMLHRVRQELVSSEPGCGS
jgi:hypothetical protein